MNINECITQCAESTTRREQATLASDPSGSIRETQERLEALCAKQGHLTATTIDTSVKGTRGIDIVCQRCGRVEQRTLTVVK